MKKFARWFQSPRRKSIGDIDGLQRLLSPLHFRKKDLPLKEVDDLLLVSFQQFMTDHYSARTANRCQGFIKRVLASVNGEGILKGNMMTRKYYTTHESLTREELLSVLRSRMPNERMQRVRDIFVLSCFTGLRLDDLRELTTDNFTVGRNFPFFEKGNGLLQVIDYLCIYLGLGGAGKLGLFIFVVLNVGS